MCPEFVTDAVDVTPPAIGTQPVLDGPGPASLFEASGVHKRFGSQLALADFAFDLDRREVHGLVGHNGSGKSTFVKILAGFHQPENGARASVGGMAFTLGDPRSAHEAGLRFVHQDLGLVETLNAVDNIVLGGTYPSHRFGRIDWRGARAQARELLASLGYEVDLRRPVGELALIDQAGIAISRALRVDGAGPARMLVLDEPTAALPSAAVARLFDVIRGLRSTGIGVLYISHHLDEIFEIADRVTVLRDGRKMATRPTSDITESALVELMVGKTVGVPQRSEAASRRLTAPLLEVRDLGGGAVERFDLDLGAGEVVGVAGVAGSGRDDVAGALFGSVTRRGRVLVEGELLPPERPDLSIKLGLGLLPSDRGRTGLVHNLSVCENLTLPKLDSSFRGLFLNRRREERGSLEWLARLDIQPREPSKQVALLSGGNQQKVLLGRWLRAEPHVLILEEPTQGVDVGAIETIYTIIRRAAERGVGFLICSSDTDELVTLCDRVLVLNRGLVVSEVTEGDLRRDTIDRLSLTHVKRRPA